MNFKTLSKIKEQKKYDEDGMNKKQKDDIFIPQNINNDII
jgi:hypothetical protein